MRKSTGVTCGHCAWSTVLARHIASGATYVDVNVCVIYVCSTYAFSMYAFSMYAFSMYAFSMYAFSMYAFSMYAFSMYASIRTAMQMKMG